MEGSSNNTLKILHLSDLHFGSGHRWLQDIPGFSPKKGVRTIFSLLTDDISYLHEQEKLIPDLILITGDLTTSGEPEGFGHAKSFLSALLTFVNSIREKEKIPLLNKNDVIIVPGNHDINRESGDALRVFRTFLKQFYDISHLSDMDYYPRSASEWLYRIWVNVPKKVLLLGLNSCEGELKKEEWGEIPLEQLESAIDEIHSILDKTGLKGNLLVSKIATFHHHIDALPELRSEPDYRVMANGPEVFSKLQNEGFDIIIHGHKHFPYSNIKPYQDFGSGSNRIMYLVSGGSIGVKGGENYYQYIIIQHRKKTDDFTKMETKVRRWTSLPEALSHFEYDPNRSKSFPVSVPIFYPPKPWRPDFKDYLEVLVDTYENWPSYYHPINRKKHTLINPHLHFDANQYAIPLEVEDLSGRRRLANNVIEEWLHDDQSRLLILLGEYGMGKSTQCWITAYNYSKLVLESDLNNARVPLLFSLKGHSVFQDGATLVKDLLDSYGLKLNGKIIFNNINQEGGFFLIFDGLDEANPLSSLNMAYRILTDNIDDLCIQNSKLIVSSRTHLFLTQTHLDDRIYPTEKTKLMEYVQERPYIKIERVSRFSQVQISNLLSRYWGKDWEERWKNLLELHPNLDKLTERPRFLNLIQAVEQELRELKGKVDYITLYELYTQKWINRNNFKK